MYNLKAQAIWNAENALEKVGYLDYDTADISTCQLVRFLFLIQAIISVTDYHSACLFYMTHRAK